jgi:STAS domain
LPIDDERPASDSRQGVRPTPITGHHAPLDGLPARVMVCDASGLAATLDTIDALARLQLIARRRGCRLQLRNLDSALEELITLIGLRDTLLPCVSTEHRQSTAVEDSDRHAGSGVAASSSECCR